MAYTAPENSADGEHWKRRYRDSVRELDSKESEWRETETRLQKNLLRLSFCFSGRDSRLDREIKRVQAGLRKNPDPADRAPLIDDLVDRIVASTTDNKSGTAADATALFTHLIEALRLPARYDKEIELLQTRLAGSDSTTLPGKFERLAEMLNEALGEAESAPAHDSGDTFQDFLSRISLTGSIGEKVSALQQRSTKIKSDLERLLVIDDTIALLTEELDQNLVRSRSAAEARALIRELIEWMTLPSHVEENLKDIQARLAASVSEQELSKILRELGHAVSQFHGNLMSELSDVEYYLKNIAVRLKELQLGIEASYKDQQDAYSENASLASNIAEQTETIAHSLAQEDDLATIKGLIDDGLQKISTRMQTHLEHDRERVENGEKRLEILSTRLKRMDEESTRLRAQVRQERERAQQDALTGIPNRAAFDSRIVAEIARHDRHARKLSLAVIDIDNFKHVNDRFGHKAGDKVLKSVAEICAANVRASDFLARYGGEEFVLVLPETPMEQAHFVAEKLRGEVAAKGFYYDDHRVPITVSVGIAQFSKNESADEVFRRADAALYAAKEAGRNRCMTQT